MKHIEKSEKKIQSKAKRNRKNEDLFLFFIAKKMLPIGKISSIISKTFISTKYIHFLVEFHNV
jgi:hypothetical protein